MPSRGLLSNIAIYMLAAFAPIVVAALVLTWLASGAEGLSSASERGKTILDLRVESVRDIRRALATPVPPPEPLGPIRTKAANALGGPKKIAAERGRPRLGSGARDAFASGDMGSYSTGPAAPYDRHSSNF